MAVAEWRVVFTLPDGETVERIVRAPLPGDAASIALCSLVTLAERRAEYAPRLRGDFRISVDRYSR